MNLFILSEGQTPRKFSFISSLFISLNNFSVSVLDIPGADLGPI